jgi:hypothetical protein
LACSAHSSLDSINFSADWLPRSRAGENVIAIDRRCLPSQEIGIAGLSLLDPKLFILGFGQRFEAIGKRLCEGGSGVTIELQDFGFDLSIFFVMTARF